MENIVSINEFNEFSQEEKDEYINSMAKIFAPKLMNGEYIDCYEMFTHPEPEHWDDLIEDEFVDLGLPSGTLWCKHNLGASSPEDKGLYFAWGEISGYTASQAMNRDFSYNDYKFSDINQEICSGYSKYNDCDNIFTLEDEDNAVKANAILGDDFDIPSGEFIAELLENTTPSIWYGEIDESKVKSEQPIGIILESNINGEKLYFVFTGEKMNGNILMLEDLTIPLVSKQLIDINYSGTFLLTVTVNNNGEKFSKGEQEFEPVIVFPVEVMMPRYACAPIRPVKNGVPSGPITPPIES